MSVNRPRAGARSRALVALCTFAALLLGWFLIVEPHIPEPHRLPIVGARRYVWIGPNQKGHWTDLDPWSVEFLALGDSRAVAGIDALEFNEVGLGPSTVLWGGGALIVDELRFALETNASSILVCLTPMSLQAVTPKFFTELFATQPIPARARPGQLEATPQEVSAWKREVVKGMSPYHAIIVPAQVISDYRHERRRQALGGTKIDDDLRNWADRLRYRLTNVLEPSQFIIDWVRPIDEANSDASYTKDFADEGAKERAEQALPALRDLLIQAREDGRKVACVRLPISASLRAIEDAFLNPTRFEQLCTDAEVPYKDFGIWPAATKDGSHLHARAQSRVSKEIARWLSGDLNW